MVKSIIVLFIFHHYDQEKMQLGMGWVVMYIGNYFMPEYIFTYYKKIPQIFNSFFINSDYPVINC